MNAKILSWNNTLFQWSSKTLWVFDTLYPSRWILANQFASEFLRSCAAGCLNWLCAASLHPALEATHQDQRGRTLCPMMNPLLTFTSAHFHFHLHDCSAPLIVSAISVKYPSCTPPPRNLLSLSLFPLRLPRCCSSQGAELAWGEWSCGWEFLCATQ